MRIRLALAITPLLVAALAGCGATSTTDWSAVEACDLIPESELPGVGLTGPSRPTPTGCSWAAAGGVLPVPTQLIVAPGAEAYDQVVAGIGAEPGEDLAGHSAAMLVREGVCAVAVDVGDGALSVVGGGTCADTRRAAEIAVSRLPV